MKTSELIAVLQSRLQTHGDLDVETTWEGITSTLSPERVYRSKTDTLLLDAYDNNYKEKLAADPGEGESPAERSTACENCGSRGPHNIRRRDSALDGDFFYCASCTRLNEIPPKEETP